MLLKIATASAQLKVDKGIQRAQKEAIARAATRCLRSVSTDLDSLLEIIGRSGGVYYPARLKNDADPPTVENFECSNIVVLDIDNTNPDATIPHFTWSDALAHPYVQAHAAFLHESPNYSTEQNRFRIGFVLPELVEDYYAWKAIAEKILAEVTAQGELVLRPTWGYRGCRRVSIGKKNTQVMSRREFERLTADIIEQQETQKRRAHLARLTAPADKITIEEAEKMLMFIPLQLDYEEWQSVVLGIANHFEQHEAIQLIQHWSPGRDRKYLELIRRAQARKYAPEGVRKITIATVIALAKKHGYIPPKRTEEQPAQLRYDRTLTVNRWVSEVATELFSIIEQNPKTVVVSRTGNGKSKFVELLARRGSVLLVSPLAKLSEQQATEFEAVGAVSVTGGESGDIAEAYFMFQDFVCTTPEMLLQYLDCVDRFDYVVIDEIHELRKITYRPTALGAMYQVQQRAQRVIGLTATLTDNVFREDGFFVINVADRRTDRLPVHVCEFRGGSKVQGNNTTALVCRLIRDHVEASAHNSDNSDFLSESQTDQQPANKPKSIVIRLQSKKQLRVVETYCRTKLQLPASAVAVLTSENKNSSPVFASVVEHRRIPDGVSVVLTTSVFDLGLNVLNTNISRLILIEPKDATEVVQFSARFRNVNLPVECWYSERLDDEKRKAWPSDVLRRYQQDLAKATAICTMLNIASEPGNRELYNKVSAISKYKFVQRTADTYQPNTLHMAAHLYREYTGALLSGPGRFFNILAEQYTYCDVQRLAVLDLDADAEVQQLQEDLKEKEKTIDEELYTCLKEHRAQFFTNVYAAYGADRELRKRLVREEFEGIRPVEDESCKALKRRYLEAFGENIFLRPLARILCKRYLHLRSLLLSTPEAVRIVDTQRTPEAWHNCITEFETLRRQYLLEHSPAALSPKWKKEAEAVAAVASVLQQRREILTGDVLQTVNEVMHPRLFAMKKRESAKLIRILFGTFKRRGREKITYYDCSRRRTFRDTLQSLHIEPEGYLSALQITADIEPTAAPTNRETVAVTLASVDSK